MEWGRTESNCQSRRRVVYSHLGSPHSQCIPMLRALGRIRTSNHQVRSLALWSIELRGRVSCTCEWRMRASNPPVVPGANRVTTPSSPIPQSPASTGRGSRTPTENLHWFLRPARLPIPPYRCVVNVGCARGWRESNSRPTARQADALPLSHTPKGVKGGVRGARILVSRASTGRLDRLSYHPTVSVLPISCPRIRRGAGRNRTVLEQGCNLLPEPLGHGAANISPRAHQLQFPLSRRYRSPGVFSRQVPEFPTGLLLVEGRPPHALRHCASPPQQRQGFPGLPLRGFEPLC